MEGRVVPPALLQPAQEITLCHQDLAMHQETKVQYPCSSFEIMHLNYGNSATAFGVMNYLTVHSQIFLSFSSKVLKIYEQ